MSGDDRTVRTKPRTPGATVARPCASECRRSCASDPGAISYFISREIVVPTPGSGMAHWRESLFATMSRNAGSVADFFKLPHNCVVELGTHVQI